MLPAINPIPNSIHGPPPARAHPPPARRSLLGSARTNGNHNPSYNQGQHKERDKGEGPSRGGAHANQQQHTNGNAYASGSGRGGGGGSTVPQKRKLGLAGGGKSRAGARGASGEPLHPAPSSDWPGNGERGGSGAGERGEGGEGEGDEIRCRCGSNADDGFSIACDVCGRWCHAACFGIVEGSVPEEWACWDCVLKGLAVSSNGHAHGKGQARRRASVSGRRASTVEMERSPPTAHGHGQQGHGHGQGQHMVDGDDGFEDERSQYVSIDEDVVPHASTQRRLRAYAAKWRGVSALSSASAEPPPSGLGHTPYVFPGAPPPAHPTTLFPLFPSSSSSSAPHPTQPPAQSQSQNQSVLPPTYALHAARPARPATFLAPFPSVITPSSVYLRDPLNGYAHSGAPKRFVHLVGPPLDVCLDARGVGGRGRWVRSGCWPNAEVRAYVCGSAGGGQGRREGRGTRGKGAGSASANGHGHGHGEGADAEPRTHFGIFATRALRQGEEIVVGWEWDDGNAVHRVGEVVGEPGPAGVYGIPSAPTLDQRHLLAQLANILHALGGAECACTSPSSSAANNVNPSNVARASPAVSTAALHPHGHPAHSPPEPKTKSRLALEEEEEEDDEEEGKGECVLRAIENAVFPPPPVPAPTLGDPAHREYGRGYVQMDVDVDIDIEGEGESVAASSLALHGFPTSSTLSAILHPPTSTPASLHAASTSTTTTATTTPKPKPKRLAGPGVPPPSPEAPPPPPRTAYPQHLGSGNGKAYGASAFALGYGHPHGRMDTHAHTQPQTQSLTPTQRWGPLVGGPRRGVHAVERVRGGGGWGGVELVSPAGGEEEWGYGHEEREGERERESESERDYAVVERAGGWDVLPAAAVAGAASQAGYARTSAAGNAHASTSKGWETEEDVDVVGDVDMDSHTEHARGTQQRERVRGHPRSRDPEMEPAQEAICPPKMRKRWRPDGDAPPRPVVDTIRAPEARTAQAEPREVDPGGKGNGKGKGKGKERAHAAEDEPMDVDVDVEVDVEVVDATADPAFGARNAGVDDASPQLAPPPLPPSLRRVQGSPRFALQTSLLNPQLAAGTSPSTSFARLSLVSPHPGAGGARPAWFAANAGGGGPGAGEGVDVDVLGEEQGLTARVAPAVPAEAVHTADAEPLPLAETLADPSPRVRFVEPEGHVEEQPHSPHDDQDQHQHQDVEEEDMLLLDVGAEEPYRPSPASPSPAPESDEEIAVTPEMAPRPLEEEEREKETQAVVDEAPQKPDEDVHESSMPVERDASAPVEEAVSAPAEPAVAPPMETTVPEPASPVEGSVASDTVRSPEVPATAAPVALTMKEWTARKRKQREAEKALEDERAQREAEERAAREQELEKEREKDAQGEHKENAVGHKPDRLTRYLDDLGSVARAVVDKSSPRELPAQEDVEMADAAPLLPVQEEPEVVVEKLPPKPKGTPLTMTSFVSTGGHGRLSPLTVSSVVDSRTPSPGLANGGSKVKRESSPLVVNGIVPPAVNGMASPAMPNGVSKPATLSSVNDSPPPPAVSPIPKPVLQSPKAPRYLSPTFTSNGVHKSAPAAFAKALPIPSQSSSPSFTSNGIHRLPAPSPKPPAFSPPPSSPSFRLHARAPSQEEGEILPSSSPPPPRSMYVFGAQAQPRTSPFSAPSAPPTQPRSHQQQHGRMPPSAPKALREAQNPLVGGASAGGRVRGGGSHFGGLGPSNFPNNSSFENQQSQQNQQNQQRGNRRPNHFRPRRRNG